MPDAAGLWYARPTMQNGRFVFVLSLVAVSACGGGSQSGGAKSAADDTGDHEQESIADIASRSGGIRAIGDGARGESGPPLESALAATLLGKSDKIKLDGIPREWPPFTPTQVAIKGSTKKPTMKGAVVYDDQFVYVGGQVNDASFVRTSAFGDDEDHASFIIAFPDAKGVAAYEVGLYAGKAGESRGSVRYLGGKKKGSEVSGAEIVEAPSDGGYTFEAKIPFAAFPEASRQRVGLRGALRYYDASAKGTMASVMGTGPGSADEPDKLEALPTEAELALIEGFLKPRHLATNAPKLNVFADVTGDEMRERISIFGQYLTLSGPTYRRGREYFFRDMGADVTFLEARRVTGRDKDDLVIRRRFVDGEATREWIEIWSFLGGDEPTTTFAHEILVSRGHGRIVNEVELREKAIVVSIGKPQGFKRASYHEAEEQNVIPILLPWDTTRSMTYKFDGARFVESDSVKKAAEDLPAKTTPQAPPPGKAPPTPKVEKPGNLAARVLEMFRKEQGVAADDKPSADLKVDVDGDTQPERITAFGDKLVVTGPGFRGGRGYAFVSLSQVASPGHPVRVDARDLTGNAKAELIIRTAREVDVEDAKGKKSSVTIEAMFVYTVEGERIRRVFAIETAREMKKRRVQALVQFVPASDGKKFEIDATAGRAHGWTKQTYPWGDSAAGASPVEPLVLPWGQTKHVRYQWDGHTFTPKP